MAIAMGMFGLGAAPANAASLQNCKTAKGTLTMSPGLSSTSTSDQKVTIKGTESGCAPAAKTGGTGQYTSILTLKKASCATLVKGGTTFTGNATTKWKNGKTSTYRVTYKDGTGNNVTKINMTGTVTKGLFVGKKFSAGFVIAVSGNPNCTTVKFTKATWKQTKAWIIF